MAYRDKLRSMAETSMAPGESYRAGMRVSSRGATLVTAVGAGVGAAAGYLIGGAETLLASAIGGGVGGGVGALLGVGAAFVVGTRVPGTRNPFLAMVITDRAVRLHERSPLSNRPRPGPAVEVMRTDVRSMDLGPKRLTFPRKLTVSLRDGTRWDLEAVPLDDPEALVEEFDSGPQPPTAPTP